MQRTRTPPLQRWPGDQQLGHRHGTARWHRPRGHGPLRRSRENRLAGGVAGGLAERIGRDATAVRVVFALAALAGLFGVAAYVVAWLLIPAAGEEHNIATRAMGDRRGIALAAGVASLLLVVLVIASALGASWLGSLAWPLIISAAGTVLIWRNARRTSRR